MTTEVKTLAQAQAIVKRLMMDTDLPMGDFNDLLGVASYLRSLGVYLENSTFAPDWSKAPAWATYAAAYDIGSFKWFECKPRVTDTGWATDAGREQWDSYDSSIALERIDWRQSLVRRPRVATPKAQVEPGAVA